ncbi:MAG TPA: TauD/TfdA family dioxygenase [Pilimelia sp.]|nr:TauD/TfdA family dioxygenase [Pilimelia sp.]
MAADAVSAPTGDPAALPVEPGRPAVVRAPAGEGPGWVRAHRAALLSAVTRRGAVLVRGVGFADSAQVAAVFRALAGELMADREPFAPRVGHGDGVYSSSRWPGDQPMCMHHELSYALRFPRLMLFACRTAPVAGGVTGLADSRALLEALPPALVDRLEREGWILTRSYREDLGVSWSAAFDATDRDDVARYCRDNAIAHEWRPDGSLLTRQRRPAVIRHPVTGERCWFNQLAFLNEWTMDQDVRAYLVDVYGAEALPFTTSFGNGDPVGADVVQLINDAYEAHTVREPWRDGDLLVVDNVRTAHSREPYSGPREVLVGMGDPVDLRDCLPPGAPSLTL